MKSLLWLIILLCATRANAHALTPISVWIEETTSQHYQVRFRRSAQFAERLALEVAGSCTRGRAAQTVKGDQLLDSFELTCARPLQGQTLRIEGLRELALGAVVQIELRDGRSVRALLSAEVQSLTIPAESYLLDTFRDYLKLGVKHLLTGLDHVLFVLGLLCLIDNLRRVLWTLTAFTLGHSLTLALSAVSIARPAQAPVEVGIALSLLVVALEIAITSSRARSSSFTLTQTRPFRLAGAFGLLHGLGFAGALSDVGFPEGEIALSLFAFNLGVELGQILLVAAALTLAVLFQRWWRGREHALRLSAAYVIGSLSVMWCLERVLVLL